MGLNIFHWHMLLIRAQNVSSVKVQEVFVCRGPFYINPDWSLARTQFKKSLVLLCITFSQVAYSLIYKGFHHFYTKVSLVNMFSHFGIYVRTFNKTNISSGEKRNYISKADDYCFLGSVFLWWVLSQTGPLGPILYLEN